MLATNTDKKVIALMYHGTPAFHPASRYSIHVQQFSRHLDYLHDKGWTSIVFRDLKNFSALPDKSVMITFDDGYADNYTGAYHQLLRLQMKATWFIATDYIGGHALWMGNPCDETRMLTQEQISTMAQNGMEIASHTATHPRLSALSYTQQLFELTTSKQILEEIINNTVHSIAYPYGRYSKDTLTAVEQAGYSFACTTKPGKTKSLQEPYQIRRITILANDTVNTLARKLKFADNDVSLKKLRRYYWQRCTDKFFN